MPKLEGENSNFTEDDWHILPRCEYKARWSTTTFFKMNIKDHWSIYYRSMVSSGNFDRLMTQYGKVKMNDFINNGENETWLGFFKSPWEESYYKRIFCQKNSFIS